MANRNLRSGTVTFLFTDVEGSTKLLHALGAEGCANALARNRRILTGSSSRSAPFAATLVRTARPA